MKNCTSNDVIFIEDYDPIHDDKFSKTILKKYLKDLFEDLHIRSQLIIEK